MDVTPFVPADRQLIQSYGDGGFRISGQLYRSPVLVFPLRTQPWPINDIAALTADDLAPVLAAETKVEVLVVGCGPRLCLLPGPLRRALSGAGIGLEAMDTGAACRTYNILLAEGRRVAAALVPV